ncbi:MAG: asparagine synthase C-terminal domain-containing protein, partial [Chlamydiota bacterium]
DHWVEVFDEPFGDQAALPTLLLSQLTHKHVKVVLTGEGADEVFAGYSNYSKRLKEAPLSAWLGSKYSPLPYLYPFLPAQLRKNRVVKAAGRSLSRRYTTIPNLFDRELHPSILSQEFSKAQGVGLQTLAEPHYFSCDSNEYLDRMLHIDANLWLADDLLTKVDRATMAYSIEARVPYLDHRLVEFAARLPSHFKMRAGDGKYLLKRLAAKKGLLPPEIISRPKRGFVIPLREWMGAELKPMLDETLSSSGLLGRNIFRPGVVEKLLREEKSQRRLHATRIWSLLALELWFRRYAPNYQV